MLLRIKMARARFPHYFVPQKPSTGTGGPKYNGNFLLGKDDPQIATIQAAMLTVAEARWPGNGRAMLQALEASKRCLRDGDTNLSAQGSPHAGFPGHVYLVASSSTQPGLFDCVRDPATGKARVITNDNGTFYDGCYVNVHVDVYAYQKEQVRGVFAELRGVQFAAAGERFSGSPSTADEFDAADDPVEMPETQAPTVGALGF